MKIKSIILNVLFIIILICLIYFFIYLNNSNFENFTEGILTNPEKNDNQNNNIENTTIESQNNIVSSPIETINEVKVNNGLTFNKPLKNANFGYILESIANDNDFKPTFIDGYYWINIQDIGTKYIYCIMDKNYFGGGWMLAMRSVFGSKNFSYDSPHFKESTLLNNESEYISQNIIKDLKMDDFKISSIGNKIYSTNINEIKPNIYDAKFDTFNNTKANEWMAIFYVKDKDGNIIRGGDYKDNNRGWVWYEKNVKIDTIDNFNTKIKKIVSPLELFQFLDKNKTERKLSGKFAQNMYGKFTNATDRKKPLTNILFSSQPISERNTSFYGLNYISGRNITNIRWGFNFNDSNDKSNDAFGGIGTSYNGESIIKTNLRGNKNNNDGYSAGNFELDDPSAEFLDRPVEELRNTSYAVEWYVREIGTSCS